MEREIVKQAVQSLKRIGANIMPSVGWEDKTWWVEDNGLWGSKNPVPYGLYFNDEEIVQLAKRHSNFAVERNQG